jgi:hypothetical protein
LRDSGTLGPVHGGVAHAAASAYIPPYPESSYNGALVTLRIACPAEAGTYPLFLTARSFEHSIGSGVAGFPSGTQSLGTLVIYLPPTLATMDLDLNANGEIGFGESDVPIAATLTINCV